MTVAPANANDLRAKLQKFAVTPSLTAKTTLQAKIAARG